MKRFSERIGITKPPVIQLDGMDEALRNSLWNVILTCLGEYYQDRELKELCNRLALHFFKTPLDEIRDLGVGAFRLVERTPIENWIKKRFYSLEWYGVYNLIEFLTLNEKGFENNKEFQEALNYALEGENSGYHLVDRKFVPITNEQEIKEIEEAIERADKVGIEGAREHLSRALSLLAQKPEPDYRNSIKESISAVASVAAILSGKDKDDFAPALEKLSEKIPLHGALKEGFKKLYGYTSDEDGIRHAILEDSNVGYDEAKFMLVSCSAFVNFLFSKAQKAGLIKDTS